MNTFRAITTNALKRNTVRLCLLPKRHSRNVPLNAAQAQMRQLQPLSVSDLLQDESDKMAYYSTRSTYAASLEPIETAWSLLPEAYTDDVFNKLEKEKVFKKSWVAVEMNAGRLADDGDVISTKIAGIPILITNDKGTLKAFYNVCRHRASILLKEGTYKNCKGIRCPYHSWNYSCGGKLIRTPFFNDDKMPANKKQRSDPNLKNQMFDFEKINFKKKDYGLFEIGVREFMGTLFVNLDQNQERRDNLWQYQMGDLEENYGHYPFADMRTIKQYEYTINANWKLIAENFIEYYHLPWIHPELCEVSSVANHIRRQGRGQYTGFATYPLTYGGTAADPDAYPTFKGLNHVDAEASWFIQVFPNISYFIFPHHIISLITYPTDQPGVTKEKMSLLMDKSIKEELAIEIDTESSVKLKGKIKELSDFYVMVNNQDIWAVENVQVGINSNDVYRGGRLSAKFEEPVYRFQNILIDYMTDNYLKEYPGDEKFVKSEFLKPL